MRPTDENPIIFASVVQSFNYEPPDGISDPFSVLGTKLDLETGTLTSTGLVVDGVTGDLSVRGEITASELVILDGATEAARFFTTSPGSLFSLDTGFAFAFPGVEAARTRGVSGGATGALGVDTVGIGGDTAKFSSQVSSFSELSGGDSYQYGTAEVYGYSNIDTGYAEATLFTEAQLGSPAGSGALAQSSIKVIAVPEGYTATSVPYSIEAQGTLRVRIGLNNILRSTTTETIVGQSTYELRLGEWTSGGYAAMEADNGYVLLGRNGTANDGVYLRNRGTGPVHIGTNNGNDLTIVNGGAVSLVGNLSMGGAITSANGIRIDLGSAADPSYSFSSDTNTGMFRETTDRVAFSAGGTVGARIESGNFWARGVWFTATASTVDVRAIDGNGRLGYFSSSLRTKSEVEPVELERARDIIDRLEPIWYRSTNEVDRPDWSHYGFAAEHVIDVDPRFVGLDTEGEPMTVAYSSLVVPLVAVVQDLAARLEALESTA